MDICERCTFSSTETGAEAVSRICRTRVNEWFLGGGMGTETTAEEMGKFTCRLLAPKKALNQCTTPLRDCCTQMQQSFVLNVVRNRLS